MALAVCVFLAVWFDQFTDVLLSCFGSAVLVTCLAFLRLGIADWQHLGERCIKARFSLSLPGQPSSCSSFLFVVLFSHHTTQVLHHTWLYMHPTPPPHTDLTSPNLYRYFEWNFVKKQVYCVGLPLTKNISLFIIFIREWRRFLSYTGPVSCPCPSESVCTTATVMGKSDNTHSKQFIKN